MTPLLLSLTPAFAGNILIYHDVSATYGPEMPGAATLAGHTPTVHDRAGAAFLSDWTSGTWDAVMVESGWTYLPTEVETVLTEAIGTGVPVVFSYWDLDANASLQALLGVTTTLSFTTAQPTIEPIPGDPYGLFSGVGPLRMTLDMVNDDGDILAGGATAATSISGAIIAFTHGDTVAVNGFLPVNYANADDDLDGLPDVHELLVNELDRLIAPRPELHVVGSCPGPVTVRARNLTPLQDVAIARASALGSFTIPGGHCRGYELDLRRPQLAAMVQADATGTIDVPVTLPAGQCGAWIQVVDMSPCRMSDPEQL